MPRSEILRPLPPAPAPRRRAGSVARLLLLLSWLGAAADAGAAGRPPARIGDVRAADSLLRRAAGNRRVAESLRGWVAGASLPDLMYLLRNDSRTLGPLGSDVAARALRKTPGSRRALADRLTLRLAELDPFGAGLKRVLAGRSLSPVRLPARPTSSVFRVGAVLPLDGPYEVYGRSVQAGLLAALGSGPPRAAAPELWTLDAPGDDPAAAAAAADTLAWWCAAVVGELLSPATYAVAALSLGLGAPVISPTATDESVGQVGDVFQVGPSGYRRGRRLARAMLRSGTKVALLQSSAEESQPLVKGFRAEADAMGARVVWENNYAPGSEDFRGSIRAMKRAEPDLLLWEGDSREAEQLLRQLAAEKVRLAVCGGSGLDPRGLHAESLTLFEGVVFVGEDWKLSGALEERLTAGLGAAAGAPNRLHVRGYLAGRALVEALSEGALCSEELATALRKRTSRDPYLAARGFLEWGANEVSLPVFRVERGRAAPLTPQ